MNSFQVKLLVRPIAVAQSQPQVCRIDAGNLSEPCLQHAAPIDSSTKDDNNPHPSKKPRHAASPSILTDGNGSALSTSSRTNDAMQDQPLPPTGEPATGRKNAKRGARIYDGPRRTSSRNKK